MQIVTRKTLIAASAAFLLPAAAVAQDCNGDPDLGGANLNDQLVCAYRGDDLSNPMNRWSEIHYSASSGPANLGEWGRGAADPAGSYDENVGTWSYNGNAIRYAYGSYDYTWYLCGTSGDEVFCDTDCNSGTIAAQVKAIIDIPSDTSDSNPCTW
jgi:hypothetical protein